MIIQKTGDDLGAAEKGLFRTEDIMCSGSRHGPLPGGFGAGVILGPMQVESEPNGLCGRQRSIRLLYSLSRDMEKGSRLEPVFCQTHWWVGGAVWEDGTKVAASKTPVGENGADELPRSVSRHGAWLQALGKLERNVAGVEGTG